MPWVGSPEQREALFWARGTKREYREARHLHRRRMKAGSLIRAAASGDLLDSEVAKRAVDILAEYNLVEVKTPRFQLINSD